MPDHRAEEFATALWMVQMARRARLEPLRGRNGVSRAYVARMLRMAGEIRRDLEPLN